MCLGKGVPASSQPVWLREWQINMEAKLRRRRKNRTWRVKPSGSCLGRGSLLRLVGRRCLELYAWHLLALRPAVHNRLGEVPSVWSGGFALGSTDAVAAESWSRWSIWSWSPLPFRLPISWASLLCSGVDLVICFLACQREVGWPQRPRFGAKIVAR